MDKGGTKCVTLLWRVENFSCCESVRAENSMYSIESPRFHDWDGNEDWWCYLELYPKGKTVVDSQLSVELHVYDSFLNSSIDCEWALLGRDGSPLVTGIIQNLIATDEAIELPNCPQHVDVFDKRKERFLPQDTLTVRCRIWSEKFYEDEQIYGSTRLELESVSYKWSIKKFSSLQLEQRVHFEVPIRHVHAWENIRLSFCLKGKSLLDSRCKFDFEVDTKNVFAYKVIVQGSRTLREMGSNRIRNISGTIWKESFVLSSRKRLLQERDDYLHGDVLNLLFEFTSLREVHEITEKIKSEYKFVKMIVPENKFSEASCQIPEVNGETLQTSSSDSIAALQDDLMILFQDHPLSDLTLRCGNVSFPVHKNILSVRSPVFKAMFSGDMRELHSDFLDMPDVDHHSLGRMLTFLYSGTLDRLEWEGAAGLYYAADKYQVASLKKECSEVLRSCLTVKNVSDVLALADRHQDQELTTFVKDFILQNYDDVMVSEEWGQFMEDNSHLAGTTAREVYKKMLVMRNK